jgi:type IV pilus assembly protein PilB
MPDKIRKKILEELKNGLLDISIINLIDHIIEYAQFSRASDIHIEPKQELVKVRFRIDGVLQDMFNIPSEIRSEIVSRVKVLASLRTDEHQKAQDGRFSITFESKGPVDIRVSIVPTYYGEKVVLRLLSDKEEAFTLEKLGLTKPDQEKILREIKRTHGMILSTGPTGSGKTSTLYTILKMLRTKEVSIVTIEDPIEYAVEGIDQIQVNSRVGLSFSNGLRSILRQDPDIIMVGEIRDSETAALAVNTALTGHLLLSTLHTNDAATTLPRLLDMHVEPYLVASTVNIVMGQRLVRKLCTNCKAKKELTETERRSLAEFLQNGDDMEFFYGKGCNKCNKTGYKGRIGIYEVMVVDNDIRDAFLRQASSNEIKTIAQNNGMTTMVEDGVKKVRQGITTIEEVLRVINE